MTSEKKHLKVDSELHKKLKTRASKKGTYLEDELKEILTKELESDPNEWGRSDREDVMWEYKIQPERDL